MTAKPQKEPTKKTPKVIPLWRRLLQFFFADEPWRRTGSRVRKVMSRLVIYLSVALLIEACWSHWSASRETWPVLAILGGVLSVTFFVYTLIVVPLMSSDTFHLKTRRVMATATISTFFMILTFAHLYRWLGLNGPDPKWALDYVYFSAVTFSTLGFGEFHPSQTGGRLVAAMQALMGNLHLAIIVAVIFLRMSRRIPPQRK